MEGSNHGSSRGSKANAKGSWGGKAGSKGRVDKSKGNPRKTDRSTQHPEISGKRPINVECASDSLGKCQSKGKLKGKGQSRGKLTGCGLHMPSDTVKGKGKGKGAAHAVKLRLAAQDHYSEPKCVKILQPRYGCEVGAVLDIEGQSRDGRNWLEARNGGVTLPKSHEGVGWKKLHGDVERPKFMRVLHGFAGSGDVKLRVEGETEDHRSWLTECGQEIPKAFINTYWYSTDSSSEGHATCDDSSDGLGDGQHSIDSENSFHHHVASIDGTSDVFDDHERFPEYLRDERPDLDSDGLEELYHGMLQDDAEEFGGYQCDSD